MLPMIRLYLAPIVLGAWILLWVSGVRGDFFVGFFAALVGVAWVIMQHESVRRWRK